MSSIENRQKRRARARKREKKFLQTISNRSIKSEILNKDHL
jgi:hypothetical protein